MNRHRNSKRHIIYINRDGRMENLTGQQIANAKNGSIAGISGIKKIDLPLPDDLLKDVNTKEET